MKILKYVAFAFGGIAVVLVGAFLVAALMFDADRIKQEIAQAVRDAKQRTLTIEGDLALSFWPSLGVKLGRTQLSERASEKPFASVESAHVSLAVLPLLKKDIVIDHLDVRGVRARVVRARDGSLNIDDLLAPDEKKEQAPMRFDISGVHVDATELAWQDDKAGQTLTLRELKLDTGRLGNAATGKLDLSARIGGDKPALALAVKANGSYDYDLDQKRYAIASLAVTASGDAADLKGLETTLSAAGLRLAAAGAVEADALQFNAKGKLGGDALNLRVDVPKLSIAAEKASGAQASAAVQLTGAQRSVQAKLNLARVEGGASQVKVESVQLDLDARQGDASVKGILATPLAVDLGAQRVELARLNGDLTVSHPQMPMKSLKLPLTGALRADLAKSTAAGNLATQFDESKLRLGFTVPKFSPLALGFELDVDKLNVDRYFPPKPAEAKKQEPEKPFDFSALKGLNLNGTVRIGALQVSNVKAANLRLDVRAANGRLDVNPLSANLYQGSLNGSLAVNAGNNQVALRQTLSDVAINPLMKDALNRDLIEGRGTVAMDLVTAGTTVGAMKKALGGTARVQLRDGAVKGINLAKSFRELKAKVSTKQDAEQKASQTDNTDFSELSASFRIAGGVARNDDLAAKSPFLRLSGAGDINIGEGTMNYVAKAAVVGTSGGQEAKELAELKGVTVPVRVTGPFESLSYRLEFGSLVGEIAKAKVEAKVNEATKQIQDKAADKLLKGIFK